MTIDDFIRINQVRIYRKPTGEICAELPKRRLGDSDYRPVIEFLDRDLTREVLTAVHANYAPNTAFVIFKEQGELPMSDDEKTKLAQMIASLRAIERSAGEGVHLIAGRGDISLELTLEEVETHIRPLLGR